MEQQVIEAELQVKDCQKYIEKKEEEVVNLRAQVKSLNQENEKLQKINQESDQKNKVNPKEIEELKG